MMNAIELLKKDHAELKDILQSIISSRPTALKTREKLIHKLYKMISLHTVIEEKLIYPLALKQSAIESLAKEAYEEHNAVDILLKKALKVEVSDEYWIAKCSVIKENLEHHITEEEENMFPVLSKLLSEEDLERLGKEILKLKEKNMKA